MRSRMPLKQSETNSKLPQHRHFKLPNQDSFAILCDASYHPSGFILMIQDYFKNEKGKQSNFRLYYLDVNVFDKA